MADSVAAAIRRASQAARNAMEQLDASTVAELTRIYTDAAEQVRAAIGAAGSKVRVDQLRGMLDRIDQVLAALATARTQVLDDALQQAAELGVRPFTAQGLAATGRSVPAVLDSTAALDQVDAAVRFVANFRDENGLALSDRLWRVDRGATEALHRTIEAAVVQGWSADKAAQEFMMRGQAVPPATQAAQRASETARLMQGADYLQDPSAGALASMLRVMRTEVNRAHGEAYMNGAEQAPGFVGFKFLLSPRHPRADVCDLYARQNLHGLGPGVYPTRKACPWPAHPNTLSFVVAVFEGDVSPEDQAGKETTMQALERLGPDLRAGILGPTKATYFDQGLLTRGMVRSTVGAVQRRIGRQA